MKKLLILGGTKISCEIVRKAREMGIRTAVTDYNPPERSPGKQLADESFMTSCTDVDGVVSLIAREHFDGVLTGFSDLLLPFYAEICRKAGLPAYGTREQFELFTDKDRYKALMRGYGVPTVEEYAVDREHPERDAEKIRYPVLVKPVDNSGARGISVCYAPEQFRDAYQKARDSSGTGKVLVERYLTGKEVTVFWTFRDGEYELCGIGNRHVKQNQEGVIPLPVGYTFPAAVTPGYLTGTAEKVKEMFRAVGIRDGMMFMQCRVEDGVCVVYDIGYRLTGSLEYKLFRAVNGYDPLEMMIDFALTGKMGTGTVKADPFCGGRFPYNVSCLARPGKIREIRGLEAVRRLPGVLDVVTAHEPGEQITPEMRGLLSQITVRVLGIAEKKADVIPVMRTIERMIEIISDNGENLRLSGMEPQDVLDIL